MSHWYYYCNGPIDLDELTGAISRGDVDRDTLVWRVGMSEWVKVRKHPDLVPSIMTPPPLPAAVRDSSRPLKRGVVSVVDVIRGKRKNNG